MRLQVGWTAGQKDTIQAMNNIHNVKAFGQRGQCHRIGFGPIRHCLQVFLSDHVERVRALHAPVRNNTNQWAATLHCAGQPARSGFAA